MLGECRSVFSETSRFFWFGGLPYSANDGDMVFLDPE
jgi:hypothetical protein